MEDHPAGANRLLWHSRGVRLIHVAFRFLARILMALLALSGSAFPAQNPIWWQNDGLSRLESAFDRMDPLRWQAAYLEGLQIRVETPLADPSMDPKTLANLYEELLYLRIHDKQQSASPPGGSEFSKWPTTWNLQAIALPLVENWPLDDPRWLVPFAPNRNGWIQAASNTTPALQDEGL
ncbi:MAG: hypothetical protein R3E96_00715 [Planctomycetota bacterium]